MTDDQTRKIVVNQKYSYVTNLPVQVGDRVLPGQYGRWEGVVTGLESSFTGQCKYVLEILDAGDAP